MNGIRVHIKVEVPRKLYWADKLGLLVVEDLPNSWGEPDELMRSESEYTLKEMIKRDYNHPSIFLGLFLMNSGAYIQKSILKIKSKMKTKKTLGPPKFYQKHITG